MRVLQGQCRVRLHRPRTLPPAVGQSLPIVKIPASISRRLAPACHRKPRNLRPELLVKATAEWIGDLELVLHLPQLMLCVSFTQRRLYVATNLGSNYSSEIPVAARSKAKYGTALSVTVNPSFGLNRHPRKKAAVRYPNAEVNPEKAAEPRTQPQNRQQDEREVRQHPGCGQGL